MIVRWMERLLLASRWLLAPLFLGLVVCLFALLIKAGQHVYHVAETLMTATESEVILSVLGLVDLTLAVAGFTREELDVSVEENQLVIRGRQQDDKDRQYLHRGIAARQFQRAFLLADGMQVLGADLKNGLLSVDLARPEPERVIRKINILARD